MITQNELDISNQSYTHKDFYQIFPEILEIATQLSNNGWDPSSSNESDPGVILLKLLAFIADKNNYNIDKNILECFMVSATQEDSMKKLCDMMGYNMKYYNSATVRVGFMWVGDGLPETGEVDRYNTRITLPKFTQLKNENGDINYFLTEPVILNHKNVTEYGEAIEGKWEDITINDSNLIKLFNLDDNRRFYMPESVIAENGIWIWNAEDTDADDNPTDTWTRVDNLNIQQPNKPVWKFGYDSRKKLPYILFPEDIAELIGEGLRIRYTRTSGVDGNIIADVLTALSGKTTVTLQSSNGEEEKEITEGNNTYLIISNPSYTSNGINKETIDDAYESFKKTIGTFDTLITCRDYANAIYKMTVSETNKSNLVSNIQVSDIKDDINFTNKIATFNDFGLVYLDTPQLNVFNQVDDFAHLPTADSSQEGLFYLTKDTGNYYKCIQSGSNYAWALTDEILLKGINNFDLYFYPLNPVSSLVKPENYNSTFRPNTTNLYNIKNQLEEYKTLSHQIKQINTDDKYSSSLHNIYLIKNYYSLKAKISTTYKVSKFEGTQIIENIKIALYNNFNSRKLDYGEEIPFDALANTIKNADYRISSVYLEEPDLTTKVMMGNSLEKIVLSADDVHSDNFYNYLLSKNIIAGRLPLFDYDTRFDYCFGQKNSNDSKIYGAEYSKDAYSTDGTTYTDSTKNKTAITYITTSLMIPRNTGGDSGYKLKENEQIQLLAPNFRSTETYPVYVNYFIKLNTAVATVIGADTEYKLGTGEYIWFNYTDSNNIVQNVKYTNNTKEVNGVIVDNKFSGIIKPNFDLQDSETYYDPTQHDYRKKEDLPSGVPGMFTLEGTEQIEIRDFVKTDLKSSPTYCYWKTNNNNELQFHPTNPASNKEFEYILDNNEYFFYTDSGKNVLVTLGSGTKLTLYYPEGYNNTDNGNVIWRLSSEVSSTSNELNIDDIYSKGIGAFADTDWVTKKFNQYNWLRIYENQIINLGEGDIIKNFTDQTNIDSSWKVVPLNFEYNSQKLPVFTNIDNAKWQIRTVLNLNLGPNQTQTLVTEDGVEQKIIIYGNAWYEKKDNSGNPVYLTTAELEQPENIKWINIKEKPLTTAIKEFEDVSLRSNYLFQQSGGKNISAHIYNLDGSPKDNFMIYPFEQSECVVNYPEGSEYDSENIYFEGLNKKSNYVNISLNDFESVDLPVYIPKQNAVKDTAFGLFMVYYVPGKDINTEAKYPVITNKFSINYLLRNHPSKIITALPTADEENYEEYKDLWVWVPDNTKTQTQIIGQPHYGIYKIIKEETTPGADTFTYSWDEITVSTNDYICTEYKDRDATTYIPNTPNADVIIKPGINIIRVHKGGLIFIYRNEDNQGSLTLSNIDVINLQEEDTLKSGINFKLFNLSVSKAKDLMIALEQITGEEKFYYNCPMSDSNEIDVEIIDPSFFFNYNNICNKFVLSQIDTNTLDIQIAKSSRSAKW